MADTLKLSFWFPGFEAGDMLTRLQEVLHNFPFSEQKPGVHYTSVQPLNWNEPSVYEEGFSPAAQAEDLTPLLDVYMQPDYAITMEAYWDLWVLDEAGDNWVLRPEKVSFTAQGLDFDDGTFAETGHILIDFGLDYPFLHEEADLDSEGALRVKANVATLIEFTHRVEHNLHTTGRVLWSESEENLAQKLIARLQQIQ